jgi:hypothetical protein
LKTKEEAISRILISTIITILVVMGAFLYWTVKEVKHIRNYLEEQSYDLNKDDKYVYAHIAERLDGTCVISNNGRIISKLEFWKAAYYIKRYKKIYNKKKNRHAYYNYYTERTIFPKAAVVKYFHEYGKIPTKCPRRIYR